MHLLKVAVVLGTRPEIIKMSPVIRALEKRSIDHFVLHTGQHYDYGMDGAFFEDLKLASPKYNLGVGSGSHAEQTAKIMVGAEKVLTDEKPDIVLVQGDTNTVLGVSLVSSKLHIPLGHVEAGLRSFDRRMPEEVNRVVADHLSDLLFAPTSVSRDNLLREGLPEERIHVTGNTVVDAVKENLAITRESLALSRFKIDAERFFLVTIHRAENVNDLDRMKSILSALRTIKKNYGIPVVFPVHPRTRKMIEDFNLNPESLNLIEPLGYLDFLHLTSNAKLIITDSGGVQEEACILKVPCVTLRENTERPETVNAGSNILAGVESSSIVSSVDLMLKKRISWSNPFGDGKSGDRIVTIISEKKLSLV